MEATPEEPVVPGIRIDGLLARGGSSTVWSGTRADGQRVAVKVLAAADETAGAGATGDLIRATAQCAHVVPVLDVVALVEPYASTAIVMPLLGGGSLARIVGERGRLSAGELVTALSPVAGALACLHDSGIVHGDVAPGNVLFDASGRPALADLGVARVVGDRASDVWATDGFAAPEVEVGGPPTAESDVYGLGACAWFALTGEVPGPSSLRGDIEGAAAGLDPRLASLVRRCLAVAPGDRPDAVEVALELFDTATPEPLRLPAGAGDVVSLTRRMGLPTGAVEPGRGATPTPRRRPSPAGALRRQRHRVVASRRRRASARHRSTTPRRGGSVQVALAVLAVLAVVGGVWLARRAIALPSPTELTAATPRSDRALGVAQRLLEARAAVWVRLDEGAIGALDAPGSPSWTADLLLVRRARQEGWSYAGVRLTARSADLVETGDTATVQVTYDSAAYEVRRRTTVEHRPALMGLRATLRLKRVGDGWRVSSVEG